MSAWNRISEFLHFLRHPLTMGIQFSSFPATIAFLLFISMVLRIWSKAKAKPLNLPPGPWKLPIIGNMHQMIGSLPHHKLRDLAKKHGALMHLQLGEVTTIVASSPEMGKEIMKTQDISFAQRPTNLTMSIFSYSYSDIAFSPYGESWRQFRKICVMELLSGKRVRSIESIREEETANFLTSISSNSGSVVDVSKILTSASCRITAKAAFGKNCKDQETFLKALGEFMKLLAGFSLADAFPSAKWLQVASGLQLKLEKVHKELDIILQNIINGRLARMADDDDGEAACLADVLLRLQDQGDIGVPFTANNVKAIILDMFSAGTETTSTLLEWAMSELLKDPRVIKAAQAEVREAFDGRGKVDETSLPELKYLHSIIKETLRLHPPVPFLPRECRQQCQINGYDIPIRSKIILNQWAIGRDPNIWIDAEKFHPERFLDNPIDYTGNHFEYLPFGAGRRICPGILFGTTVAELLLASLLYHFDWKLPVGITSEDLDMTEEFGLSVGRKNSLRAIPILCHPIPTSFMNDTKH